MTRIKFCGLTRAEDVAVAGQLQVDAVGFVLWPGSPRYLDLRSAARLIAGLSPAIVPVGVFVRPARGDVEAGMAAGIRVAQIHGAESLAPLYGACTLWVAGTLDEGGAVAAATDGGEFTLLLDAHDPARHGGTGRTIDWEAAARVAARRRVMLAGGLTPDNVGEAIRRVRPYGVDVSTGIEQRPGVKDAAAMRAFVAAVRMADADGEAGPQGRGEVGIFMSGEAGRDPEGGGRDVKPLEEGGTSVPPTGSRR